MAVAQPAGVAKARIPLVEVSLENEIGIVTLNNPEKRNALSAALIADILGAGQTLNASGAKVAILRAARGVRVWSAGHDVKELPTNGRDPLTYNDPLRQAVRAIHETRMPVIAMIEGSVWGGACEVVMACDLVVAAEGSTFALTPAKLGIPYDIAGMLTFMQRVGLPILKEMLFTAQPISADRALQVGLVNQVVSPERLEEATMALAAQIARNSPLVISLLKEELRVLAQSTPLSPNAFERIQALRQQIYDSADYQEGIRSFFERRPPRFHGR